MARSSSRRRPVGRSPEFIESVRTAAKQRWSFQRRRQAGPIGCHGSCLMVSVSVSQQPIAGGYPCAWIVPTPADGSSEPEQVQGEGSGPLADVFPDGRKALWLRGGDIFIGALGEGKQEVFFSTPTTETVARFSPNGRHVAYVSDESGVDGVYIREFPSGANRVQVSAGGGSQLRWSADGAQLLFVAADDSLMSAAMRQHSSGTLRRTSLQALCPLEPNVAVRAGNQYDVSPDGERFVIFR